MQLQNVMSVGVVTIGPDESASTARAKMRRHRIRHLVVVDEGQVAGIVSERDLGGARAAHAGERPVRELMTTDVVSASPATTVRQAANLMRGRTIGCLLVRDGDQVTGLVTTTDLLDQLGRGALRPTVRTERPPLRRPPGTGAVQGRKAARGPTGPRGGRRPRKVAAQRTALPAALPRVTKPARGRAVETPPAHVRVLGASLDPEERAAIANKLGRRFGKFAASIERITVRVMDVNGPRGGVDHSCAVKVVLTGLPSVVVERTDASLPGAVDAAIAAAALAVRRSVQRRRLKPLHHRARLGGAAAS